METNINITYYATRKQDGTLNYAWARLMGDESPTDFLCTAKKNWKLDLDGDLMYQLMIMPDYGFDGEISPEKLQESGFPLLEPAEISKLLGLTPES